MKRLVAIASLAAAAAMMTQALAAPLITLPRERTPATACEAPPSLEAGPVVPDDRMDDLRVHAEQPALTLSAAKLQAIRIGATGR